MTKRAWEIIAIASFTVGILSLAIGIFSYKVAWDMNGETTRTQKEMRELLFDIAKDLKQIEIPCIRQLERVLQHFMNMNQRNARHGTNEESSNPGHSNNTVKKRK